jgi:hypothetical protein
MTWRTGTEPGMGEAGVREQVDVFGDFTCATNFSKKSMLRIRCLFDPCIRDPGWVKNQDPDLGAGSRMNILDHISESLETIFWVKIPKFGFGMRDKHPGSATLKNMK